MVEQQAWCYGNEAEVGQGIRDSGVPRREIFITGKLWSTYHSRVAEAVDLTLESLGTDYLDLCAFFSSSSIILSRLLSQSS